MSVMIDTPDGIRAFALLQVYHKLKMEVDHPNGPTWRFSPRKQALSIMAANGLPSKLQNVGKKKTLQMYEAFLIEIGVIQ